MADLKADSIQAGLFETVASGDFGVMVDINRYKTRTEVFDRIIADTDTHFWDPSDARYIDFDLPFDMSRDTVLPFSMVPELHSSIALELTPQQQVQFANDSALWWLSSILHGEQGALLLSVSLCSMLANPGAVEYAANQAREEARHVTAFARYITARWGCPAPVSPSLCSLLDEIVTSRDVYKKVIGMQLLVEGLAMGIFSVLHRRCNDPVLKRLTQLVMVDEAFHHKVGKIWSTCVFPESSEAEKNVMEDWALHCFQTVVANLLHPREKQALYAKYGLEVESVIGAMHKAYANKVRRQEFMEINKVFHVLIRTLLNTGLVTKRTRHHYAVWTDLKSIKESADQSFSDDQDVKDGLAFLREINASRHKRHAVS